MLHFNSLLTGGAAKPIHLFLVAAAVAAVAAASAVDGLAGLAAAVRKKCGWGGESMSFYFPPCFFPFTSLFSLSCVPALNSIGGNGSKKMFHKKISFFCGRFWVRP